MIVLSDTFRTALKSRFLTDSEFRTLTAYLITGEGKLSDKLAMLAEAIEEDTNQAKAYAKQKKTHQNELIRQRVQRFREREREDFSPSDGNECNALPPLHGECNDCNASNGYLTIPYHTLPNHTKPSQKSLQIIPDDRRLPRARIREDSPTNAKPAARQPKAKSSPVERTGPISIQQAWTLNRFMDFAKGLAKDGDDPRIFDEWAISLFQSNPIAKESPEAYVRGAVRTAREEGQFLPEEGIGEADFA